jgi:hypothetical protein
LVVSDHRSVLVGPEEGAHGEAALAVEVAVGGEAVLAEQAVDAPLGHGLVVRLLVARVVQRHPEAAPTAAALLPLPLILRLLLGGAAELGHDHDAEAHGGAQGSHICARWVEAARCSEHTLLRDAAGRPLLAACSLALGDDAARHGVEVPSFIRYEAGCVRRVVGVVWSGRRERAACWWYDG